MVLNGFRKMVLIGYQVIGRWIVIDKRTTHASGTPLNIRMYYIFFIVYTFISND